MIFILIGVIVFGYLTKNFLKLFLCKNKKNETSYKEEWYGKGTPPSEKCESSIEAFRIHISDEILNDLNYRLEHARFENPLENSKFLYGFNPSYLKEITKYWKTEYNWRNQEKELNKYQHFNTVIEGLRIHFMHVKPMLPENSSLKVIPIMLIHGWPGCFTEFMNIIPFLTTPRSNCSFVFEVVCPSLPGFGFSESPSRKGLNARAVARIFITLMERVGLSSFYVQGGDWGSYVSSLMARYYPKRILGLHVNSYFFLPQHWEKLKLLLALVFPFMINRTEYRLLFPIKKKIAFLWEELGYFHMNSTKPDTLGSAMSDSPVGMAAYLLEKFSLATNKEFLQLPDGGLTKKFSLDELITVVMVYWVNNNFTAAARFYKENLNKENLSLTHEKIPVTVPTGIASFPNEDLMMPRMIMSNQMKNIVSFTEMPRGGHFAAMEEPELLADDLWKFVNIVENKSK